MEYGYVRVSAKDQNESRQLVAMEELSIPKRRIYADKQSGKDFNRPAYQRLMKKLRPGDVLYIHSIDRLGRNYDEIIDQWRYITKERRADIVILDMPLLDTRKKDQDLTGAFIADLVLQILSYVAQTERENIRKRQAEGIAAAKPKGVRFGRPEKIPPEHFDEVCSAWRKGEISGRIAAQRLSVSPRTFYKWADALISNPKRKKAAQQKQASAQSKVSLQ